MSDVIVNPGAETVAPSSPVISPAQENAGGNEVTIEAALAHLANWDISNHELKEFTDEVGIYSTAVRKLSDIKVEDSLVITTRVRNSSKYLALQDERIFGRRDLSRHEEEVRALLEEYERRFNYKYLLDLAEEKADDAFFEKLFEDKHSWTDVDGATKSIFRKLDRLIRDTYDRKGLPTLLAKLRELLAFSEAKAKGEPKVASEETKVLGRSPFGDLDDTILSLIDCVHLFLVHVRSNESRIWKLELESEEKSSETKDEKEKLSNWAILDRFLKQDVEKNGSAPEQLQFLYKSANVALGLEGFSPEELSALEQSDDKKVAETLACITEAREYFGIR